MIDVSNLVKTPITFQHRPMKNMYSYKDKDGTLICKNCTKCGILKKKSKFLYKSPNRLRSTCRECDNLSYRDRYQRQKLSRTDGVTRDTKRHVDFWADSGIPIKCYICSGPFEEIEHVWSTGLGGPDILDNTLPACVQCNRGALGKRDRPLCEWLRKERPEYLELVISKVLSYGVDPFTACEKVTIGLEDSISDRWIFRGPTGSREYVDITDDVMEESYRAQRGRFT